MRKCAQAVEHEICVGEGLNLLHDPRSARSMLAGRDDGRAAIYERFQRKLSCVAPLLDLNEIATCYCRFEFSTRLAIVWLPRQWHMSASRWLMYARTYADLMRWLA